MAAISAFQIALLLFFIAGIQALSQSTTVNRKAVLTRAAISFVKEHDPVSSLKYYDMLPSSPYLWQRGLVAYCAKEFGVAARQFGFDRSVNGGDGEEALWMCASLAREGKTKDELLSSLPPNGLSLNDPRPVIRDSVRFIEQYLTKLCIFFNFFLLVSLVARCR